MIIGVDCCFSFFRVITSVTVSLFKTFFGTCCLGYFVPFTHVVIIGVCNCFFCLNMFIVYITYSLFNSFVNTIRICINKPVTPIMCIGINFNISHKHSITCNAVIMTYTITLFCSFIGTIRFFCNNPVSVRFMTECRNKITFKGMRRIILTNINSLSDFFTKRSNHLRNFIIVSDGGNRLSYII